MDTEWFPLLDDLLTPAADVTDVCFAFTRRTVGFGFGNAVVMDTEWFPLLDDLLTPAADVTDVCFAFTRRTVGFGFGNAVVMDTEWFPLLDDLLTPTADVTDGLFTVSAVTCLVVTEGLPVEAFVSTDTLVAGTGDAEFLVVGDFVMSAVLPLFTCPAPTTEERVLFVACFGVGFFVVLLRLPAMCFVG
jgi:hypothetical protein